MISKLDKYIFKKFIGTFLAAIGLIIIIVIIFDISEKINLFIGNNVPIKAIIFDYYVNFLPYFVYMFSYLFIFISVIYFTSRMANNTEIVSILSAGISYRRLMMPYIFTALLIGFVNLFLSYNIIPDVNKKRIAFENQYINKERKYSNYNYHLQCNDSTYLFIETFNFNTQTGYKFTQEIIKDNFLKEKISAASISYDSAQNTWTLRDYMLRDLRNETEELSFGQEKVLDLNLHPDDFSSRIAKTDEMNYRELKAYIQHIEKQGASNVKYYKFELHNRSIAPVASIILALMGLAISSRKQRTSMGGNLAIGIALTFGFIVFNQMSKAFATEGGLPAWLAAWLPVIVYTFVTWYLIKKAPK